MTYEVGTCYKMLDKMISSIEFFVVVDILEFQLGTLK